MGGSLRVVQLGTGRSAVALALGYGHSCALLDDASVKCWGYNSRGQLGLGDTLDRGDDGGEMGASLPSVPLGALCLGRCPAGYTGPDGGPCNACLEGTCKSAVGSGTCAACMVGTYKATAGAGSFAATTTPGTEEGNEAVIVGGAVAGVVVLGAGVCIIVWRRNKTGHSQAESMSTGLESAVLEQSTLRAAEVGGTQPAEVSIALQPTEAGGTLQASENHVVGRIHHACPSETPSWPGVDGTVPRAAADMGTGCSEPAEEAPSAPPLLPSNLLVAPPLPSLSPSSLSRSPCLPRFLSPSLPISLARSLSVHLSISATIPPSIPPSYIPFPLPF